jgi:hypothetical protein
LREYPVDVIDGVKLRYFLIVALDSFETVSFPINETLFSYWFYLKEMLIFSTSMHNVVSFTAVITLASFTSSW